MAINTHISTIDSGKNPKINKQAEQKQNHRYRECFDGCQMGGRSRGWASKGKR